MGVGENTFMARFSAGGTDFFELDVLDRLHKKYGPLPLGIPRRRLVAELDKTELLISHIDWPATQGALPLGT